MKQLFYYYYHCTPLYNKIHYFFFYFHFLNLQNHFALFLSDVPIPKFLLIDANSVTLICPFYRGWWTENESAFCVLRKTKKISAHDISPQKSNFADSFFFLTELYSKC